MRLTRLVPVISLAAGLSLVAACKDPVDTGNGSAMRPTTSGSASGSASSAAPSDPSATPPTPTVRSGDTATPADPSAMNGAGSKSTATGSSAGTTGSASSGDSPAGAPGATASSDSSGTTGSAGKDSAIGSAKGTPKNVSGTLAQASADEVRVDTASKQGLRLKINSSTTVTLDGKTSTASALQEGAQVRASYQLVGDEPTALKIEAKTSGSGVSKMGSPDSASGADKQQ